MATPRKEPMDKHFQNDQRRHNENEAESHLKRGCVRTEQTETEVEEDAEECLGAVGGQGGRQHTGSARAPVDSFRQLTGYLSSPQTDGLTGMNEVTHLNLPQPADIERQFQIEMQRIPEHLRRQLMFNQWFHQRTPATDGITSEDQQYQIEQKKLIARWILTHLSDELRFQRNTIIDEKVIDRIIESLERLFH